MRNAFFFIDPILAATFCGSFKHPWFCSHFFSFFFPLFSGVRGFCSRAGAQSSAKPTGGARFAFFPPANAGGSALGATYLRQTRGAEGFSAPFLGMFLGLLFLFCFFEGWASEKEAAEATRAEELASEEAEEQGGEEEKEEEGEEETEEDEEEEEKGQDKKEKKEKEKNKKDKSKKKKEGKKGKHGRKENRERKRGRTERKNKKKRKKDK